MWKVEVVSIETGEVVKTIPCGDSESKADRVSQGVDINLDHERFLSRVVFA